jgi:radical SAM protein with 4Fe4S-binding SPASM domain
MCIRPSLPAYPDMELRDFTKILDQLPRTVLFSPHGYGEPLKHAQFMEFMEKVSMRGLRIALVTNGTLLYPDVSKEFISKCKPYEIVFSVDAGRKREYEEIRQGANFEEVKQNIREAIRAREKLSPSARVIIYCTLGRHNLNQVVPLSFMAAILGADQVSFTDLTLHGFGIATRDRAIRVDVLASRHAREAIQMANHLYGHRIKIAYTISKPRQPSCRLPWMQTFVQANGDVFPCTDTLNHKLGNINEQPFSEIWNGPEMQRFRIGFGSNPTEECKRCVAYS